MIADSSEKQIYSVSVLTKNIKAMLEKSFAMIWISGEISDLRIPSSGHAYFSLNDDKARIAAVMFRGQRRHLKFNLANGESVVGLGRISVYEPRGTYQIILEYVEPRGAGALQLSFEQLKVKLAQEGLFEAAHKKTLPFLPKIICVITSPTGAAIRDIIHVTHRRFPTSAIEIFPVKVQGDGAAEQVAHGIEVVNRRAKADVIIVARGGGSVEDLAPFNTEIVARAVFNSHLPVVTGIGHEIDYSIADFVADLRAPTPSAAAEMVLPVKRELEQRTFELRQRCMDAVEKRIDAYADHLARLKRSLVHPLKRISDHRLRADDLADRLRRATESFFARREATHKMLYQRLLLYNPYNYISKYQSKIESIRYVITDLMTKKLQSKRHQYTAAHATLLALSPIAVLKRGYSITRRLPERQLVTRSRAVQPGQGLEIQLAEGIINATVEKTE